MSDLDTKEEKEPKPETSTEVKTDENVWQNILRKSTTKSKDINSNLIVLGDKKNGKSLMLDKFSDRKINSNAQQYVLDYSYLQVKNKHNADKEETLAHLNIWQIDDPTHLELLPMLLNSTRNGVGSTVYMITLNLAEPSEAMDSLSKWLKLLEQVNEKVMEGISASEKENLKRKISHHIQFYVDPSVQQKVTEAVQITEEETKKTKLVDPAKPDTNLGVPLIIVGCQADSFKRKSAKTGINTEDDEKFDFLTRRLRKVCLTYGATLVYTSSNGTKGINIEYLQDYLYNRLYNIPFKHSAKVVGSVEEFGVAIPSGHDNKDLIETDRAPSKSGWNDETAFEEVFKKRPKAKEKNKNEAKVIDAQPNEEFFRQLSLHTAEPSSGGTKEAKKPRIPPMEQDPIKKPAPTGTTARPTAGTAPTTENNAAVKQFFRSLLTSSTAKGDPSRSRSRSKDKTKHKSTGTSKAVRDSLAGGTDGEAAPPAAAPAALPSPTGTSAPTTTEEAPKAT